MFYMHEQRHATVRIQVDTNPLAQMGIKCCTSFVPAYCTRVKANVCTEDGLFVPEVYLPSEKAISLLSYSYSRLEKYCCISKDEWKSCFTSQSSCQSAAIFFCLWFSDFP